MKILMLNYEFPPMGGGAGNATNNISKEMARMGNDVTVLTSRYAGQRSNETKHSVKIHRVFSWRKSLHDCGFRGAYTYLIFSAIPLWRLCRSEKYDVIHYFFSLPTGLLSLGQFTSRKTPYIVSLRGSDVPYYDVYDRKVHYFNIILKPVNRYIWKKAKKVVALSNSLRLTALRTSPSQQIGVIPNGVETEIFRPSSNRKRAREILKLITVSRLVKRKGIHHLLLAISQLKHKNIELVIAGTGNYESALKNLCDKLKLNEVVKFSGYVLRESLPELYNDADVFILPSLAESFGLVFAEAMACKLPIIAARSGGIVDLVHTENGILVEPGNVREIKNAILQLERSPELRIAMGKANRQRILSYYSWKVTALNYLDVYKSIT